MTNEEYDEIARRTTRNVTTTGESQLASGVDVLPGIDTSPPDGSPRQSPDAPVPHDDDVCHPLRYTKGPVECIDAIDSAVTGKPPEEAVCVANIIKYLWRYEEKEPVRSLRSANWYLERLIGKVRRRTMETAHAVATETRR